MDKDYLVFWYDGSETHVSVVRVTTAPHDTLRGAALSNMLKDALDAEHAESCFVDLDINGAVELPPAAWANGRSFDVIEGDVGAAVIECSDGAWRVIL